MAEVARIWFTPKQMRFSLQEYERLKFAGFRLFSRKVISLNEYRIKIYIEVEDKGVCVFASVSY